MSPDSVRATFPGLVYQLGNLLASSNAVLQAKLAAAHGNNYGEAMAVVAGTVAVVIVVLMFFGTERRGVDLAGGKAPDAFAH
jgi:SHS family lactate transporter-like MFS transporter